MILDFIDNSGLYAKMHPRFAKAFEWLRNTNLKVIELGKHIIDGDEVYASVSEYTTKPLEEGRLEAHTKYIDIQYMVDGAEYVGWEYLDGQRVTNVYNSEKDIAFYAGNMIKPYLAPLQSGFFVILMPRDLHAPCLNIEQGQKVRKVVVKVLI
jgi:YhcH/YjgK/YiaL family protein